MLAIGDAGIWGDRLPMSWSEVMKATALAAPAYRNATAVRNAVDVPWTWNPHEVWLKRIKPTRQRTARSLVGRPLAPRKGTATRG